MNEDPLNIRILDSLRTLVQGVTIANGYKHDLAEAVFLGRLIFGDKDPLPMVAILEPPVAPDQIPTPEEYAGQAGTWDLLIQGFVKDDKRNPTEPAYRLLADVRAALATERARPGTSRQTTGKATELLDMGGVVTSLDFGRGVCRPADDVSANAYFWLNVTLGIAENAAMPYS